jgi:hypothetical protein
MKVYVGCIDHRYGRKWCVAATEKELLALVAAFCREWWHEIAAADRPAMPESDQAVVKQYFDTRGDERWEYGCEDLPLPPAVIEALASSTTQLKDLANGWPHGELHEPLATTIKRNEELLKEEGVRLDE